MTNAAPISLDRDIPKIETFSYLGTGRPFGVPMQLIVMIGIVIVASVALDTWARQRRVT